VAKEELHDQNGYYLERLSTCVKNRIDFHPVFNDVRGTLIGMMNTK
jgi:hypothetical protein